MGIFPVHPIKTRGFTLVELMITLVIAAILLAIAIPGFQAFSQRSQQVNVIGDVSAMIVRARSEAATRAAPVTLCISSDQATCDIAGNGWEVGWIMFVDGTNAGIGANQTVDGADVLLQVGQPINGGTLRIFGFANAPRAITFRNDGMLVQQGSLRYCDARGLPSLRAIVVNLAGQVRVATDTDADGEVEDHAGVDIGDCTL